MVRKTLPLATLAVLAAGCSSAPQEPRVAAASPAPRVTASAPAPAEYLASGPIVVENQVEVTAQREGVVASLAVDLGSAVKKGDVLAMLDDRQLAADRDAQAAKVRGIEADLKNWEALTMVAETERERGEKMWKEQLITAEDRDRTAYKAVAAKYEVDRERENLNQAKATLESLQLELSKAKIVAPFGGVVARRYVTVGQKVSKDEKLFWVTATEPMRVRFMLAEKLMDQVRAGTELSVVSAADAASSAPEMHSARVLRLSPVVDAASGTIEVVAEITGPAGKLRPGMTANIKLK